MPEFYEERNYFKVVFKNSNSKLVEQEYDQSGAQTKNQTSDIQVSLKEFCQTPKNVKEIKIYFNIKSKRYVAEKILKPLIQAKYLEYTNKNSINAKNQKYITINLNKYQ